MNPLMPRVPRVHLSPRELGELAQLLFEWPIRQAPRLALPFCILLAAILQTSTIFLFSISYEVPSEKLLPAPQVYFLPADSAATRQLSTWLEANDPAVFSPLHAARDAFPAPPPLKYRPSYEDPVPPLLPLPAQKPGDIEPPMIPTVAGIRRQQQGQIQHPLPAAPLTPTASEALPGTVVRWQDELAERTPVETPGTAEPVALSPSAAAVRPPLYQVAVSPEGLPTHCVLIDSSGDPASDEAARVWILSRRFQASGSSSWGRVLVLWGAGSRDGATNAPKKP